MQLQSHVDTIRKMADVYVINSDTPQNSRQLKKMTGISVPVLLDQRLAAPAKYDMLPKPGQPMGEMTGFAQMGFVIVDPSGIIRVQRVDTNFGAHAGQIQQIVDLLAAKK